MQDFVAAEAVVAAVDCVAAEAVVAAVDCVAAVAVVSVRALLVLDVILLLPGFPLVQGTLPP